MQLPARFEDVETLAPGRLMAVLEGEPVLVTVNLAGALGRDRFAARGQLLSQLQSPYVLKLLEQGPDYWVLENVDAPTLTTDPGLHLFDQLLEALREAHEAGLVHTELRPDVIFVAQGRVKLDFSPAAESDLPYLAPEQTNAGLQDDDPRVDIYALGVILYQLITRELPFQADNPLALIDQILHRPAPSCGNRAVERALQKDPALRQQSIAELQIEMQRPVFVDSPAPPEIAAKTKPFKSFFQSLGSPSIASSNWLDD